MDSSPSTNLSHSLLSLPFACVSWGSASVRPRLLFAGCCWAGLILHTLGLHCPCLIFLPVWPELAFPVAILCACSWGRREDHYQVGNTENSPLLFRQNNLRRTCSGVHFCRMSSCDWLERGNDHDVTHMGTSCLCLPSPSHGEM